MSCPTCGHANPEAARFCNGCGGSLVPRSPTAAETRKVVTILFADLIGSTALHERLDPESVSRLMERYYQAVRVPVEAHGGTVVALLGDGRGFDLVVSPIRPEPAKRRRRRVS